MYGNDKSTTSKTTTASTPAPPTAPPLPPTTAPPPMPIVPMVFVAAGPPIVNVDSALKGYDVIKGDMLTDGDNPGFRNQIFDPYDPNNEGMNIQFFI